MNKQQTINLKLAHWLGFSFPLLGQDNNGKLCIVYPKHRNSWVEFNPFSATQEGRAQFAECWIRAAQENFLPFATNAMADCLAVHETDNIKHDNSAEGITATMLEAIYYAIGGTDTWSTEE